jgi:ABC-type Fe3+-siderophore transport system permease subunit
MTAAPVVSSRVAIRVHARRPLLRLGVLGLLCLVVAVLVMGVGSARVEQPRAIEALFGHGTVDQVRTIRHYELPRILMAFLIGSGLAVSGAVCQSVMRNPLASPDIIGVVKGAALGAVILLLVYPAAALSYLPFGAFAGGLLAWVVVYLCAYRRGLTTPARLVLVGVAVSSLCESIIRYVLIDRAQGIGTALVWLSGSLAATDISRVWETLLWVGILVPLVVVCASRLDVLGLGDDLAHGLGVAVERTRRFTLILAVLLASACVAVAGTMLFVGLIAPHIARRLVGSRHAVLLPAAAAIGTLMLLVADAVGRGADPPVELPAGMVTVAIGAPYFVYLLCRPL